jgi:transcriptional regulator with XRE-family HTH domain
MSRRALAGRSGLGMGTLARIEASRCEARISTLVAIAFGLGVPLPSLLTGVPGPEPAERPWVADPTKSEGWSLIPENARLVREVVGRNLRLERERSGISQRALARNSCVGEDTIVRIEAARQEPKLLTLVALSFGLNVSHMSLLAGLPSPMSTEARH